MASRIQLTAFASFVSLGLAIGMLAQTQSPGRIEYSLDKDDGREFSTLRATSGGKTYTLIDQSKQSCLQIVDQRDWDSNGLADALLRHVNACGGNGAEDSFFFVSAFGNGRFILSDEFGYTSDDPVIEKWQNRWSVVVAANNEGYNHTQRPEEIRERFVVDGGKAVKVEESRRKDLPSLLEMRSEIFSMDKADEQHSIEYDLDGDGKKDLITASLWVRWGRLVWTIHFANGKKFEAQTACKRIGVLSTKTNGVNDLVCDQDTVLHWNSQAYQ